MTLFAKRTCGTLLVISIIFVAFSCDIFEQQIGTPPEPTWENATPRGIVYVDSRNFSTYGYTGHSWEKAYPTLQEGINRAAELFESDEIAPLEIWVAKGVYNIYESGAWDTVNLSSNIAILAGFNGDENPGERSSRDWELNKTILDGSSATNSDDRVNHVVTAIDVNNTVIDGFTIRLGNSAAPNAVYPSNRGAGMLVLNSSPAIKNCRFENNEAHKGAGLSIYGDYSPDDSEKISSPSISNTVFSDNSASLDGGGALVFSSGAIFEDCIFRDNDAAGMGGGLSARNSNLKVRNCTFENNNATKGGGIHTSKQFSDRTPAISNTIFRSNTANYGAGLYSEGVTNSVSRPAIRNCTFSNNTASNSGGAIHSNGTCPQIENSILWEDEPQEVSNSQCQTTASSCIVEGGWQGAWDENPRFLDPPEDLRIDQDSFAIDMGDEKTSTLDDAMGNRRWDVPGIGNAASAIDLGAFEYSQGIVTGKVADGFTGQPLQDVQLEIFPSSHSNPVLPPLTNGSGEWSINGNESIDNCIWQRHRGRAVKIVASKSNYHDQIVYKTIRLDNGLERIDFVMFQDSVDTSDDDNDGLWDSVEEVFGTSAVKTDSDNDGLPDAWEVWGHNWVDYATYGYAPDEANNWLDNEELNPPASDSRYEIIPVFFMPTDLPEHKIPSQKGKNLFLAYLRLTQERYRHFLGTDTFRISSTQFLWHKANGANWYYCRKLFEDVEIFPYDNEPTQVHLEVGELMEHYGENFDTTNKIFVIVYVNPRQYSQDPPQDSMWYDMWVSNSGGDCINQDGYPLGGGRPMWKITELDSGGVMQMSYESLTSGDGTLSTITHELGHAFGLIHINVRGSYFAAGDNNWRDLFHQKTSPSIMSYNASHRSLFFDPFFFESSVNHGNGDWLHYPDKINMYHSPWDHGMLLPEELYVLDEYVDTAFPQFRCDEFHDICTAVGRTYQGDPDSSHLGKMSYDGRSDKDGWNNEFHRNRLIPVARDGFGKHGFGYELYMDGTRKIHRPFVSFEEAKNDCDWRKSLKPTETVECYYNGIAMD